MVEDEVPVWEQPAFEDGLDAIAVDLITDFIQQIFAGLDPLQLVENGHLDLTDEDKRTVARLVDEAVVELDIAFRDPSAPHE